MYICKNKISTIATTIRTISAALYVIERICVVLCVNYLLYMLL